MSEEDIKSILDRLDELEAWKIRVQCPTCKGIGEQGIVGKWAQCNSCMGLCLREKGKVYCE